MTARNKLINLAMDSTHAKLKTETNKQLKYIANNGFRITVNKRPKGEKSENN